MNKNFEIKSTNYPHDMSSWCTEKMATVVDELSRIANIVNNKLSENVKEEIMLSLYPAIYDATKMLAFSCGAEWNAKDRKIILEGGEFAFEKLMLKYGIKNEVPEGKGIFEIKTFIEKCEKLLTGNKSPNRTLMHDLFRNLRVPKDPLIKKLEDVLEEVTMGEKEWEEFVPIGLSLLSQLKEKIS